MSSSRSTELKILRLLLMWKVLVDGWELTVAVKQINNIISAKQFFFNIGIITITNFYLMLKSLHWEGERK
jgi:hypothetical protein